MNSLIQAGKTKRGTLAIIDNQHFSYVSNGPVYSPNVWHIQDQFVKQDADARRAFLSDSVGQDMADNTGRKQRAKDAKQRVKLVVEAFATMPKTDYLKMLAHDLQRARARRIIVLEDHDSLTIG